MTVYSEIIQKTRQIYLTGRTKEIQWRKDQLMAMLKMMEEHRQDMCDVLFKDLRKHGNESQVMEIDFIRNDIIDTINSLDTWTKPEKVARNLMTLTDEAYIHREPYGIVLVMGAWNYPIQLTFGPMLGAIAAGNCVILKPSEVAANTAQFLEKYLPQYLDKDCVHVINGGVKETTELLKEKFDYIFYTGNSQVAKVVSQAAAQYLTPMTLELGGKSPCYIHPDSDLDLCARRILWGKFVNAGQTCIAPDYILCNKHVQAQLLDRLRVNLGKFYGNDVQKSDSLGRIINGRHFNRVKTLIGNAHVALGGEMDENDNYIAPTILVDVKPTDPCMVDEIFGPVLPIMNIKDEDEAVSFINSREKPLAMYLFSKDKSVIKRIVNKTASGGVTANDCLMHCSLMSLPFGGVGNSGQGSYHGRFSYETFSHRRSCLLRGQAMEKLNDLRYPPYTEKKQRIIKWVLGGKKVQTGRSFLGSLAPIVLIGIVLGFFLKMVGFERN